MISQTRADITAEILYEVVPPSHLRCSTSTTWKRPSTGDHSSAVRPSGPKAGLRVNEALGTAVCGVSGRLIPRAGICAGDYAPPCTGCFRDEQPWSSSRLFTHLLALWPSEGYPLPRMGLVHVSTAANQVQLLAARVTGGAPRRRATPSVGPAPRRCTAPSVESSIPSQVKST